MYVLRELCVAFYATFFESRDVAFGIREIPRVTFAFVIKDQRVKDRSAVKRVSYQASEIGRTACIYMSDVYITYTRTVYVYSSLYSSPYREFPYD